MTGRDIYNAISNVDEKYLVQYESEASIINKRPKKNAMINYSAVAAAIVICVMIIFASKGILFSVFDERENITDIVTTTDDEEHGGDGDVFTVDENAGITIPAELTVSANLDGSVLYASDLDYSDPYSDENNVAEQRECRISMLNEFMSIVGITNIYPEYGPDDVFPYVDTGEAVITAFPSYLGIETDSIGKISYDSSDSDILNSLKGNMYTGTLMHYIGLDTDNLFVHRENIFMYSDDEKSAVPLSRMTVFKISNYSSSPQQLAFNLNTDYLMFKTIENYAENTTVISSVYGYFMPECSIKETKDYLSYESAIESMSRLDNSFIADKVICTVIYKPDITQGTLMPYYEFHWNDGQEDNIFCIPLITNYENSADGIQSDRT